MKKTLMLSPCGTSLLTNQATADQRKLVGKYANEQRENIPDENVEELQNLINKAEHVLENDSIQQVSKLSAELNAIIKFYDGSFQNASSDFHFLLSSDTWLGGQTAELVAKWLEKQGITTQVYSLRDLRTDNLESFQLAMSDFVKWCEQVIPGYKQQGYHIVFNLTGGFKSVQGLLQTLAMFYADEAIYIFETGSELFRLPRLPVKFVPDAAVEQNLPAIRRLALGLPAEDFTGIPDILLMKVGREYALSPWGEIVWGRVQNELYKKMVFESLVSTVVFSEKFRKSIEKLPPEKIHLVNQRVDDLTKFIVFGDKYNVKRLNFKGLQGSPVLGSTHEFYAWSHLDAGRIFCHFEGDSLVLDELGKHL